MSVCHRAQILGMAALAASKQLPCLHIDVGMNNVLDTNSLMLTGCPTVQSDPNSPESAQTPKANVMVCAHRSEKNFPIHIMVKRKRSLLSMLRWREFIEIRDGELTPKRRQSLR